MRRKESVTKAKTLQPPREKRGEGGSHQFGGKAYDRKKGDAGEA